MVSQKSIDALKTLEEAENKVFETLVTVLKIYFPIFMEKLFKTNAFFC